MKAKQEEKDDSNSSQLLKLEILRKSAFCMMNMEDSIIGNWLNPKIETGSGGCFNDIKSDQHSIPVIDSI